MLVVGKAMRRPVLEKTAHLDQRDVTRKHGDHPEAKATASHAFLQKISEGDSRSEVHEEMHVGEVGWVERVDLGWIWGIWGGPGEA